MMMMMIKTIKHPSKEFITYVTPPTNKVLLRTKSGMSVGYLSKVTHMTDDDDAYP